MSEYRIVKTVELSGMPNPALAKDLLERLRLVTAKVVENRKWRVPVLKEFYPQNRSLLGLNVNRGKSIMIRLREGHDQMTFLPWESVLGTLVHELTHNEIGEHSAAFYSMMEKVYDEVDATSSSGGSLWGPKVAPTPKYQFDGKSSKVGGGSLAKNAGIAKDDVRQLAAEAALRRMGQQSNSSGQIVGGKLPASTKTRKELFLEAEERRRQLEAGGQSGCSLTSSQQPTGQKMNGSSAVHTSSGPSTGTGTSSEWRWVCEVCTEENVNKVGRSPAVTSSSAGGGKSDVVCGWCGCMYGSSLLQGGSNAHDGTGGTSKQQSGNVPRKGAMENKSSSTTNSNTNSLNDGRGSSAIKNDLYGAEIYCIDCDSPDYNGKQSKQKSIVDLIAEDDNTNNGTSSSRGKPANTDNRDRSGSVVNAEGEELCHWTRLEARGCPCCIVLLSPADKSPDDDADSGKIGEDGVASRGAGQREEKKGLNPSTAVSEEMVVKAEKNSPGDGMEMLTTVNRETSLESDQQASVLKKRKNEKVDPADVIVID